MAADFKISITSTDLESVASSLRHLGAEAIGNAALSAVNTVAKRTYDNTLIGMIAGINLTDEFVRSKTELLLATTPNDATATLLANSSSLQPATLTSYGAAVVTAAVKNPKRSRGNASIGVPRGYRQVGFDVSVARGKTDFFSESQSGGTFFFIIRAPNGQLLTVARAKDARGKGSIQGLYGPSVLQLFNYQVTKNVDAITADLAETFADAVQTELDNL